MQNVKRSPVMPDGEITLIRFNLPFTLQGIDLYQATIKDSDLADAEPTHELAEQQNQCQHDTNGRGHNQRLTISLLR
jgi:hypothetical protein